MYLFNVMCWASIYCMSWQQHVPQSITSASTPPQSSYRHAHVLWTLSFFIYSICLCFFSMHWGKCLCVVCLLCWVLSSCSVRLWNISKRNFSSILTFILDCMSSEITWTKQDICEIQQTKSEIKVLPEITAECCASKLIYYLLVHSVKAHEEETRAHQGWILDLMIRVDQRQPPCFSIRPSVSILRCQCTISWLIKHVCLTDCVCVKHRLLLYVFCVWTSSPVNMFVCILLSDQSFSQPSPASAPHPPPPPDRT